MEWRTHRTRGRAPHHMQCTTQVARHATRRATCDMQHAKFRLDASTCFSARLRICASVSVAFCTPARLRARASDLRLRRGARGLARCRKARCDATECGVSRDAARRGAARPSANVLLSESVRALAGARACSLVSRTTRKDHQNLKLRGYIWGRFAASFWLGISKTPPIV